ncbi:hypothetical protein Phi10:1_gp005 [Cellulophaga phage phi10:1]|uniref:Nuclease-associated modular DNA-binding 1 domain-containing protein n=1 Tax=Cellulophaga phage phi10:1 TaxID=1327981 RepID=R9ZZ03_9CAUD|nr:hypothetical protein Phi10:1_gp005 [Cellulophaga phage phi10:1]AGO48346.1 hypothetical protein Phi10:1_gp005 [Cellulophaga phage phi10:1]
MGREKMKVYLYSEDGMYLRDFESIAEFSDHFGFSKNVFSHKYCVSRNIYDFEDGRVASTDRIGREGVRFHKNYLSSRFVGRGKKISEKRYKETGKGRVFIHDLDGDKIAEFKSIFQAIALTGLDESCFYIFKGRENKRTKDGLIITVEKLN